MEFFHKKTRYPFMGTRRRWYVISAVLIVAALASFAVRGLNLGIDFTGGVVLELQFPAAADPKSRRPASRRRWYRASAVRAT
jgi:preprotein translocase subunit SecF